MDARSSERHSQPCETDRRIRRSRFRLGLGVVGVVALMSFSDSLCLGATSPKHTADVKDQSTVMAEVPFDLYNGYLIVVKATIGPMKNVNVLLDTGTSPTVISQEIAHRLKLRGKAASMQTLKGTIQTQIVILPRIQIGPMDASVEVVVQDLRFIEQSLGISLGGIAGLDLLSTGSFTIDYPRRRIAFGSIAPSGREVRFETQVPFLTVNVTIEGQAVRLLVDSGAEGLLVYGGRLQTRQDHHRLNRNFSITSAGGKIPVGRFHAQVSLGKVDLGAHHVAVVDSDSASENSFDGFLGLAKVGFHRVSFDFEHGLFGWD